jgi:tRNA 2-selenouridine synthase
MAFLLKTAGFQVWLLPGGYKRFRRWVREMLALPRRLLIVGGMTGTGKTEVLQALALRGEQVLDLEGIAHHRGSSYGHLNLSHLRPQPTTEQFENTIALQWFQFQADRPVWIEAESKQVGTCRVPPELFQQMERAPIFELQRSPQERIQYLVDLYGTAGTEALLEATDRIRKRLGPEKTNRVKQAIEQGDLPTAIEGVLSYYDQTYRYDLNRRAVPRFPLEVTGSDGDAVAILLQQHPARSSRRSYNPLQT